MYKPSLELPEVRKFRPNFVDTGDGTKKMDPMLACRVVVIKWVAQFTHLTRFVHCFVQVILTIFIVQGWR